MSLQSDVIPTLTVLYITTLGLVVRYNLFGEDLRTCLLEKCVGSFHETHIGYIATKNISGNVLPVRCQFLPRRIAFNSHLIAQFLTQNFSNLLHI
jgi:hypothetical protein